MNAVCGELSFFSIDEETCKVNALRVLVPTASRSSGLIRRSYVKCQPTGAPSSAKGLANQSTGRELTNHLRV